MPQRIRWTIAGAGLALTLAITGCANPNATGSPPAAAPDDATTVTAHQVTYDVTIDDLGADEGTADMTFEDEGGTVQQGQQATPWSYQRTATVGEFLYLSAQNNGDGEITCTISVDGQQVKTSTSSGEFAICQTDGTL